MTRSNERCPARARGGARFHRGALSPRILLVALLALAAAGVGAPAAASSSLAARGAAGTAGAAGPSVQRSDEPLVAATLSSGVVKLGAEVVLQLVVENAERAQPQPLPPVDGLAFGPLQGPQRSFRQYRSGGRTVSSIEYSWFAAVRPLRTGDFELPPIALDVDGTRRETQPLRLTVVEDLRGEELGFFRIQGSAERLYEGEPLELTLEFGWDRAVDDSVDYANLMLPWWDSMPGWIELEDARRDLNRQRLQIGLNRQRNRTVTVEQANDALHEGRSFRRFVLARSMLPTRPGVLDLPKSFLEFRRVTRRGQTFLDRDQTESFFVPANDFEVEVLPLPEDGRPFAFTGAVGRIEAYAEADVRDVDAGDSIKLAVDWTGHGNFEFFGAPALERDERFADFRVYGAVESKAADRRRVVYDLAPLGPDATEIPSVRLPYFDTANERYDVVATEPIPIRVRALEGRGLAALDDEGVFDEDVDDIVVDVARERGLGQSVRPGGRVVAAGLVGLPLLWFGLRSAVRRRGDPGAPLERRRRRARKELARACARARSAGEQLAALDALLAARTKTSVGLWVGEDVAALLEERGVELEADALAALRSLRSDLEAAAWGGDDRARACGEVLAVADRALRGGL